MGHETATGCRPRRGALLVTLLVLGACLPWLVAPAGAAAASCDVVASPSGSDASGDGSVSNPYASAAKLVASLARGQTGCFRAGTYPFTSLSVRTPRVTLTSYPGEQATLRGRLRLEATADGAAVENLALDGRNPSNWLSPLIYADHAVIRSDDITNDHTAICVLIGDYPGTPPPQGVLIEGNRIHDCGALPATNHDHGIYVDHAVGTVIRDNWIYDNADRGVQLYPEADRTTVTGNVIVGNGEGVIFGQNANDNLVEGNVIADSVNRYNISSANVTGTGNVVRDNCVWSGRTTYGGAPSKSGIQAPQSGFRAYDNRIAPPSSSSSPTAIPLPSPGECTPPAGDGDASGGSAGSRPPLSLSVSQHRVRAGERFQLSGRILKRGASGDRHARIMVRKRHRWHRLRLVTVSSGNRFRVRVRAHGRAAILRYRAEIAHLGRSRSVRVRVVGRG